MGPFLLSCFLAVQSIALALVNQYVPEEYMDEPFHGPQTRRYCHARFREWDPKITTFPGLYLAGTLYGWARYALAFLAQPMTMDAACRTPFLRSLNVLLSAACCAVIHSTLLQLQRLRHAPGGGGSGGSGTSNSASSSKRAGAARRPGQESSAVLYALALALYPTHWFFSFLYYTDVASLLCVLVCYRLALARRVGGSAAAGAAAVACRQTNAVWVAFVLGASVLRLIGFDGPSTAAGPGNVDGAAAAAAPASGSSSSSGRGGAAAAETPRAPPSSFLAELCAAVGAVWQQRRALAAQLWPLALVPAGFVGFLVANGGSVVVGDKEAHKPVKHGAQLLYFAAWCTAMLAPQLLWPSQLLLRCRQAAPAARARPLLVVAGAAAAVAAAAGVAHTSTLAHPYLLADNRHYTFYVWRKLLGRNPAVKYVLAPVCAACWALLVASLARRVSRLWLLGFAACLAATLVPAWLLEFRYFTPGFYFIALHLELPSRAQAAALLALYGAINVVTLYVFLTKPYTWADGSTARFMW